MRLDLRAKKIGQPASDYLDHVGERIADVLPEILSWRSRPADRRLPLESRLYELEHACRIAREKL